MDESLNVFDEPLEPCGTDPVTGFYRDGCCNTSDDDEGSHTVCIEITQKFLEYPIGGKTWLSRYPVPAPST